MAAGRLPCPWLTIASRSASRCSRIRASFRRRSLSSLVKPIVAMASSSCRTAICGRERRCVPRHAALRKEVDGGGGGERGAGPAMVDDPGQRPFGAELPHVPLGVAGESRELGGGDLRVLREAPPPARREHGAVNGVVLGRWDDGRQDVSPAGRGEVEGGEQALYTRPRLGASQAAPRKAMGAPRLLHREGREDAREGREEGVELRRQWSCPPLVASAPRGRLGGSARGRSRRGVARGAAPCP